MTEKRFDCVLNEFDEIEYITDTVDCEDRDFIDFLDFANDLADENVKLKTTIKEVIGLLEEEVDLFSDKATKHDLTAYRELQDLDNKDAFWMATATKKAIKMLRRSVND